ncbi:hypothetical protein [Actinomadura sp. KC345]|uniref:hypothetical protein n=1 Tax=Actinomadura sp. KC345 TaxID=2530371 RepID=UPI001404ACFE|nr:hypothetical protein [Actinomadura sp. KC345]
MAQNTVVSRHLTSDGVVVWTRCACGRLRMDLIPHEGGASLTAGPCPHCASAPARTAQS